MTKINYTYKILESFREHIWFYPDTQSLPFGKTKRATSSQRTNKSPSKPFSKALKALSPAISNNSATVTSLPSAFSTFSYLPKSKQIAPKGLFKAVLEKCKPALILIDELADYCVSASAVKV